MKTIIAAFFTLLFLSGKAQNTRMSTVYIQTSYHNQPHFSMSQNANVTLDAGHQEISITVDFSKFKSGVDSLDEWLKDLETTKLVFKASATEDQFSGLSNHNSKTLHLKGNITLNGQAHPHAIDLTLFEISEQSMQYQGTQGNQFDKIRFSTSFSFMPKEFGINKLPHHLHKTIAISIGNGVINYQRN